MEELFGHEIDIIQEEERLERLAAKPVPSFNGGGGFLARTPASYFSEGLP